MELEYRGPTVPPPCLSVQRRHVKPFVLHLRLYFYYVFNLILKIEVCNNGFSIYYIFLQLLTNFCMTLYCLGLANAFSVTSTIENSFFKIRLI